MDREWEEEVISIIESLVSIPTVTGHEHTAVEKIGDMLSDVVDEVSSDRWGNLVATVNPGSDRSLMLAAHLDQIGFIVTSVDEDGFIRFAPVGGWDPRVAYGSRVLLLAEGGLVPGVIGSVPPHLRERTKGEEKLDFKDLAMDVGASSREEVESIGIGVGTYAVPDLSIWKTAVGTRICGPGMDDKSGLASILVAAKMLARGPGTDAAVHFVSTVQEEIGLRGAAMAAFNLSPDVAIAVDVTHARAPGIPRDRVRVELGKGPVISLGPIYHREVVDLLLRAADKVGAPYQKEADPRGRGTDTWAIQTARGGIKTGLLSIPNRYMHSPVEMVDVTDVYNAGRILAAAATLI